MRRLSRIDPLTVLSLAAAMAVAAFAGFVSASANWVSYETWAALLWIPLFVVATVPLLVRAGRLDPDPGFGRLLAWAFVLKAAATVARYLMAFVLYDGVADAAQYSEEGERLAVAYRDGDFAADLGRPLIGTGFIRAATGVIYTATGPSIYIAYTVFAWLGFWGLYFFYRAFRVALPDGDARRYALLVLFLPSMLFWPSGLGKEAFMTFGIGLFAYGSARLLASHQRWLLPLAGGLLATSVVRPHVTAALFAGLGAAYLLRRRRRAADELTPVVYGGAALLILGGAVLAVNQAAEFLGIGEVTAGNVDQAISDTAARTSQGGSQYEAGGVDQILDFPMAAVSVLFRPLPFEASNAQMMLAAAEGSLLLVLVALSWRSLREVPGRLRAEPYLILCLVYAAIFVYAFSNFSNFGILTRERVQVLPFVLVFLALRTPVPAAPYVPTRLREGALP